ncbi:MAG: LacI family transcriptional regulator [Anaerolinea sp.]|nr:LacI family transcriptional regulator [Anaerolinea sp.]
MKKLSPLPTIMDVARKAGVSIATVSRVINNLQNVSENTVRRVEDAIAALHYTPNAAAQDLAKQATHSIGLLVPEISGMFFQPMLSGIETGASNSGYDLIVQTTQNPLIKDKQRRKLAEHNTDGLLVFAGSLDAEELGRLSRKNFPVVLLFQTPPKGIKLPSVAIENIAGTRQLIDHLIEVHHRRRIVFLCGPERHEDSTLREKGYAASLRAHNIPIDPTLISQGLFNHRMAHHSMIQMLQNGTTFDAVFAGDDDAAMGVLLALREAGLRVPEDVSVVGFDDQSFSSTLVPPLTTVHAPIQEVGLQAVNMLLREMNGGVEESHLVLPTELILRQSCGCPFSYS